MYQFRVFCETEGVYVETTGYSSITPTTCPNDVGHTITDSLTAVIKSMPPFGTEYGSSIIEEEVSVSSSNWVTILSRDIPAYPGKYKVEWYFEISRKGGDKNIDFRIYNVTEETDISSTSNFHLEDPKTFHPFSGFTEIIISDTPQTIVLQVKKGNSSGVSVQRNRLSYMGPLWS